MPRFVLLDRGAWTRPGHRNDCTVRALALTCDLSYESAHAHAKRCGRKHNKGFHAAGLFPYRKARTGPLRRKRQKVNGVKCIEVKYPWPTMTVAQFLDRNRTGRFIISTRRHAMAVIDGAIHDLAAPRESQKVEKIIVLKVPKRRKKREPEPLALAA